MTATTRTTYVPAAINACLAEYQADLRLIANDHRDERDHGLNDANATAALLYLATDNAAAELTRLEAFLGGDTSEGDRRER